MIFSLYYYIAHIFWKCLLVSRYWLHLYRTKSLISETCHILTDILNFGGHLDFLFTQNSYILNLCSYSIYIYIYIDMNTKFVAQREGDIDNIIHCRQPFWVLAAILDSGWVTTCVPGFFLSYICCQHILKISCWYHEVKYSCAISLQFTHVVCVNLVLLTYLLTYLLTWLSTRILMILAILILGPIEWHLVLTQGYRSSLLLLLLLFLLC